MSTREESNPKFPIPLPSLSPLELTRFWNKVDKTASCWNWLGGMNQGYGVYNLAKKSYRPHRISLFIATGIDGKGLACCHTCDNPACVNPNHLYWGTQKENIQEMVGKGRQNSHNRNKTHCDRGHEYTPENLIPHKLGYRRCRTCQNMLYNLRKKKRKEGVLL